MSRIWGVVAVQCLLLSVAGLSGCSDEPRLTPSPEKASSSEADSEQPPAEAVRRGPSPFAKFRATGDAWEIERFESLYQLVRRSDLVIVGKVTGARWGTEYREDRGDETEVFRDLIFEVEPVRGMRGKPVGPRQGQVDVVIDLVDPRSMQLQAPVGEDAIFFLRRVGNPIPGAPELGGPDQAQLDRKLYRLVSSLGILDEGHGQLEFPLGGAAWAEDFLRLSWDDAVSRIANIGAS